MGGDSGFGCFPALWCQNARQQQRNGKAKHLKSLKEVAISKIICFTYTRHAH